jgi:hypothetical protein
VQVNAVHCRGYRSGKGSGFSEEKLANEPETLDAKGKRALADKLLAQAAEDEAKEPIGR